MNTENFEWNEELINKYAVFASQNIGESPSGLIETFKRIHSIKKCFTTHDGVDIFPGDKFFKVFDFYTMINNTPSISEKIALKEVSYKNSGIYFSTKDASLEYSLNFYPFLCLADVEKVMSQYGYIDRTTYKDSVMAALKQKVQLKIK